MRESQRVGVVGARRRWWPWLVAGLALLPLAGQEAGKAVDYAALYSEAQAARDRREPKLAIEKLNRLTAAKPDSYESWWLLAWIHDSQGKQKDALAAFRQAAATLPEGDERRAEAQRRVAKLSKALEGRVTPKPYVPPQTHWSWYLPHGRSLALLSVLALLCAQGWVRAWRADRRRGEGSDAARRARLADRLRAHDTSALAELLTRAEAGGLDADEQVMLAAAARTDDGVRGKLEALPAAATPPVLAALSQPTLPESPDELVRLATDADEEHAVAAAQALAARPDAAAQWAAVAAGSPVAAARDAVFVPLLAAERLPSSLAKLLGRRLADTAAPDRPRLALVLARCGAAGAVTLVRATVDGDDEVRAAAGDALLLRPELRPLPEPALKLITQAAASRRPRMSPEFLAVAAEAGPELARPLLRHAVDSRHWPMRDAGVELSPRLPEDDAVALLRRALARLPESWEAGSPEAIHWSRLCGTLAERPLPELLPDFLPHLARRPDDEQAQAAARLLGHSGTG